jgi:putative flippase GtrA
VIERWLKFNAVGIAGAAVQLAILWALTRLAGIQYVLATIVAVEAAILHNFVWHESWTFPGLAPGEWPRRLLRFHLVNGAVSIASNVAFTFVLHESLKLPVLAANLAAISIGAMLNFVLAHFWVFRLPRRP